MAGNFNIAAFPEIFPPLFFRIGLDFFFCGITISMVFKTLNFWEKREWQILTI